MPKILSAQIVCPRTKVWNFDKKRLHWASVVHASLYYLIFLHWSNSSLCFEIKCLFLCSYFICDLIGGILSTRVYWEHIFVQKSFKIKLVIKNWASLKNKVFQKLKNISKNVNNKKPSFKLFWCWKLTLKFISSFFLVKVS